MPSPTQILLAAPGAAFEKARVKQLDATAKLIKALVLDALARSIAEREFWHSIDTFESSGLTPEHTLACISSKPRMPSAVETGAPTVEKKIRLHASETPGP